MKGLTCLIACLAGITLHATDMSLQCGPDGELKKISTRLESATPSAKPENIALRTLTDGYYSSRDSKDYDLGVIKQAIRGAIRAGVDPYLALAILIVEAPPSNVSNLAYLRSYGIPPLDSIAGVAALNCSLKSETQTKLTLVSKEEAEKPVTDKDVRIRQRPKYRILKAVKKGDTVDLPDSKDVLRPTPVWEDGLVLAEEKTVLQIPIGKASRNSFVGFGAGAGEGRNLTVQINRVGLGGPAMYAIDLEGPASAEACKEKCCGNFKIPRETTLNQAPGSSEISQHGQPVRDEDGHISGPVQGANPELHAELKSIVGFHFMNEKFSEAAKHDFVRAKRSPYERFATTIQAYNGYGTFGVTERSKNACLTGLRMRSSPIYGAGAGDLMLNALMSNSQIRKMVEDESGTGVKSMLCREFGPGSHDVQGSAFVDLQRGYLAGRPCPAHSYAYRATGPSNGATPTAISR